MKKLTKKTKKFSKKNKKIITIGLVSVIIVITAVVLVTCFLITDGKDSSSSKSDNSKVEEQDKELQILDLESTSRPYAVMINNEVSARPYHSGLQDAYIIYEIIVEGGITRYLALFKDVDTERIHGVRSARHYYLDYALENDAYFIHWGGSPQAFSDLNTLDIDSYEVYHNKGAYYDYDLPVATEHSTYTTMELLEKSIASRGYREEMDEDLLLNYSVENINMENYDDAKLAHSIDIKYSSSYTSNFEFDEENGYYYMSVNDKAHVDYVTEEQYHFENIITYKLKNTKLVDVEDKNRQELHNIGSGEGYYISNGYAVPIIWEKDSRSAQTKYTYMDGEELIVNDGNTFIAIQPTNQTLSIS